MSPNAANPPASANRSGLLRVVRWAPVALILLLIMFVALLFVALNLAPGRRFAETEIKSLTGGMVVLEGLSGTFPTSLRLARLEIADAAGPWLVAQDIALDWSPLALLHRVAHVDRLSAGEISIARLPQTSDAPSSGGGFSLPVQVDLEQLSVGRLDVAAAVVGTAAQVSVAGRAQLATLAQGNAALDIRQLDGPGRYAISGQIDPNHLRAHVALNEPTQGLLSRLAQVPNLGALSVEGDLDGPTAFGVLKLAIAAGPLRADANGTIDVVHQSVQLDVTANAPEMHPRPDIGWSAIALDAHVHGPFTGPDASGHLRVDQLSAAGAAISALSATVSGNAGQVVLEASAAGLRIPGPKPDLLAASPLQLTAQVQLDAPTRPVKFTVSHPLIGAHGHATTAGSLGGTVALSLPTLAPLASVGGVDLQGAAQLNLQASMANGATHADLDGTLNLTGGMSPVLGLLGDATLGASVVQTGQDISVTRLDLDGRNLKLQAKGGLAAGRVAADGTIALSDLTVLAPHVAGLMRAQFHAGGPLEDLSAQADLDGDLTIEGHRGPLKATLTASGLPSHPAGHVLAQGTLDGAPLSIDLNVKHEADGALQANIARTAWKSAQIDGALTLAAGASIPQGHMSLRMSRLADLRPLIGQDIVGGIDLSADLADPNLLRVQLSATSIGVPGTAEIGTARLTGEVRDPTSRPIVDANLSIDGLRAGPIRGNAKLSVKGPQDALAIRLDSGLTGVSGADATISTVATVNAVRRQVALASLQANWKGLDAKLLSPARVDFAQAVSVDRLRIGVNAATLEVTGRASPTLDLTASLHHVTPDLARVFVPDLQADGTLQADARLTGTLERPTGTVKLVADGLHMRTGPGWSLPIAAVIANADLRGTTARLDVRLTAGANRLSVSGQAPLSTSGSINLHASGGVNLILLDPILAAQGRRLRGQVTLDATATGTITSPALSGNVQLTQGDFQDFTQGVHLSAMLATIGASGNQLRIVQFTAHAGAGTLGASGTVGILVPDIPVNITVTARNAKPLASDLVTAVLDADLAITGQVQGKLAAGGKIHIRTANIQVPENLPASIAVLNVRVPGQKPPPPPTPGPDVALNLDLDAPQAIFVRGDGLDAELGGKMHIGGTAADPRPSGGFEMVRGSFNLAGVSLNFASGEISFNGGNKIDPSLNFVANSSNGSTTATLTIGGYASAPKITLSSVPDLPQDEVLAYLLFRTSASNLTAFQLAELAAALGQISGVTGGLSDPLSAARKALGLDQLNVGTNSNGAPTLDAGRYVAKGVYVGAKQGVGGNAGTQATVQIDITKGLKLETDVGSGAGANSVGLKYEFEY